MSGTPIKSLVLLGGGKLLISRLQVLFAKDPETEQIMALAPEVNYATTGESLEDVKEAFALGFPAMIIMNMLVHRRNIDSMFSPTTSENLREFIEMEQVKSLAFSARFVVPEIPEDNDDDGHGPYSPPTGEYDFDEIAA